MFVLFTPVSMKWLGWCKTENAQIKCLGWFCDTCCTWLDWTVILWYFFVLCVVNDILWSSWAVLKIMDQRTLVNRCWSYKGRITVYTAISREVVAKNAHTTIPKGNMGYDRYAVPDTVAVKPTFVTFL